MNNKNISLAIAVATTLAPLSFASPSHVAPLSKTSFSQAATMGVKSGPFKGVEAKTGFATFEVKDGKATITLSPDFKVPASPAPHFQVVDSEGNVYLLRRLTIAGDKTHRDVVLPSYIKSVAKVQIWCAFAEVVLGEASFETPVMTSGR